MQRRPKSHIGGNHHKVPKSSRDNRRSREESRSRSKDLCRSRSSERIKGITGRAVGSNQVLNNCSPITSNSEDKGDEDEKRKTAGETNSKKGVHWKVKQEVDAGRQAKALEVVKGAEEIKLQIGEQSSVKTQLIKKVGKRLKQELDETPVEKCTLTKTQVRREMKVQTLEVIDLCDDDDNNDESPSDNDNFLKKQLTEYIE